MTEKQINNFIKLSLIMAGIIITSIFLFLYMAENNMKKEIPILPIVLFIIAIVCMFVGVCVLIFKNSESNNFKFDNNPFILVKNDSSCSQKFYDDIAEALKEAENGDSLYILEPGATISSNDLVIKDKCKKIEKKISLSLEEIIPVFSITVTSKKVKEKKLQSTQKQKNDKNTENGKQDISASESKNEE